MQMLELFVQDPSHLEERSDDQPQMRGLFEQIDNAPFELRLRDSTDLEPEVAQQAS